ncbi:MULTISPECIES: DUF1876 domain-containing protein [Actinomadura]|uniref:DUF1876 domain-containing protein n=1 Tax=Actinomadura miaoliensis TaxID=430685 RepID=A0ABP7VBA1_9ACTN
METKQWSVDIYINEHGDDTGVRAVLTSATATKVEGVGHARRHPRDRNVPEIGDELAVGRALIDLGARLVRMADVDMEAVARQR